MILTTIEESCSLHARIGWQGLTKKEYLDKGDYYLVTGVDFYNGHIAFNNCHYVTKDRYDQDQHIQLGINDVLVTKDGTIGKVAIIDAPIDKPATLNSGVFVVRPKDRNQLLPRYLMIVLQSNHFNRFIERIKVGCTIAHLNQEKFFDFGFPLPSVDEQKHIISVFDSLMSVIDKRQQELSFLDDLIKARFVEMFGCFEETIQLSEVAKITGGLTKNAKRQDMPFKLPYLRVANVSFDSIDTSEMLEIGLTQDEKDKTLLQYGDLLFVEGNGSPDQIGRVAIWRNEVTPCVHQNHLIKARFNDKGILPEFAMHFYMTEKGRRQIRKKAVSTSGLYTLSVQKVASFTLPNPPIEKQKEFATFVAQIDKSKVAVQKSLDETQLLFDSLMQQYFG